MYKPMRAIPLPLVVAASLLLAVVNAQDNRYLAEVDHLMYATPDLDL